VLRRRAPSRRAAIIALALGIPYGANATLLSGAFGRLDAGLADLLFFVHPVLITAGAVLLGRDGWTRRRAVALVVAAGGLTLTLVAGGTGAVDPLGVALALSAAVVYAGFVLTSSTLLKGTDPLVLAALTVTGAAAALTVAAAAHGEAGPQGGAEGVMFVAAVALVGTALGLAALLAGVARLGPSRASIVGGAEPVFTAMLGLGVFGDRMTAVQIVGAALVLASIPILELRSRRRLPRLVRRRACLTGVE
jgi:drug/metabolite transporter (DMT)-like permease